MRLTASLITAALLLAHAPTLVHADDTKPAAGAEKAPPTIPASLFTTERPKDAKNVKDIKASAQKGEVRKGDTVTLSGRIAGRKEPFVKGRAMFIVADLRLPACNEKPDDACATPWDLCCETPESLKANTATIQFVGADGKVLKVAAEGSNGLKNLAKLVIVGTVADVTKEGAMVISATKVHVEPAEGEKKSDDKSSQTTTEAQRKGGSTEKAK